VLVCCVVKRQTVKDRIRILMFIHFHFTGPVFSVDYPENSLIMAPHLLTDALGYCCTCSTCTVSQTLLLSRPATLSLSLSLYISASSGFCLPPRWAPPHFFGHSLSISSWS